MQEKKPARFISIPVLIPIAALKAAIRRHGPTILGDEPVQIQAEVAVSAPAPKATEKPAEKPLSTRAVRVLRIIKELTKFRGRFGASRREILAAFSQKKPLSDGQWTAVLTELKTRNLVKAVVPINPKNCRDYTWLPTDKKAAGKPIRAPKTKASKPKLRVMAGGTQGELFGKK